MIIKNIKNNLLLFLLIISISLFLNGCDEDKAADMVKITPPTDHEVIQGFHSMKGDDMLNLAVINMRAGEIKKAILMLEKFIIRYPNNPVGLFYLGQAYYKKGLYKEAINNLKRAYALDTTMTKPLYYLSKSYEKIGDRKKALKALYKYLLTETHSYRINLIIKEANSYAEPVIGRGIIGRVSVTDEVIPEKKLALCPKFFIRADALEIFASLEIIEAPHNTGISAKWYHINSENKKKEVNSSTFSVKGSKNELIPLKKPSSGWTAGEYRLEILVENEKNLSLYFYIL